MTTPKKQSGKTKAAAAQEQQPATQEANMDGQGQAAAEAQAAAQADTQEGAPASAAVPAEHGGPGQDQTNPDQAAGPQASSEASSEASSGQDPQVAEAQALDRVYAAMAELGLRPHHAKDWNIKDGRLVVVTTDGRKLSTDMPEA